MERGRGDMDGGISSDIVQVGDEKEVVAGREERSGERMRARDERRGGGGCGVHYRQQPRYVAPEAQGRWHRRVAQKLERWIFLYNVTTGLYMLDWWERCIFNVVFLVFFAVAGYNSGHYLQRIGAGLLAWAWWGDSQDAGLLLGDGGPGG